MDNDGFEEVGEIGLDHAKTLDEQGTPSDKIFEELNKLGFQWFPILRVMRIELLYWMKTTETGLGKTKVTISVYPIPRYLNELAETSDSLRLFYGEPIFSVLGELERTSSLLAER